MIKTAYAVAEDWYYIDVLYVVFLLAAAILGLAVIPLFSLQWIAVLLAVAGFLAVVGLMNRRVTKVSRKLKEIFPTGKEIGNEHKSASTAENSSD